MIDVSVRRYTMGTLIVYGVDPLRNRTLWRAIVESRLRSQPSAQQTVELNRVAARTLFAEFPPLSAPPT